MKIALLLPLLLAASFSHGMDRTAADTLASKAQQAYTSGDYDTALQLFDSVNTAYTSPGLLLNIGNCHFKLGDVAHAILSYERGLRLAPGDEDILANLDLAREQVVDRVNELPAFNLGSGWGKVRGGADVDQWARRSLWIGLLFFALLATGSVVQQRWLKRVLLGTSGVVFATAVVAIIFAGVRHAEMIDDNEAIIIAAKVNVVSEPRQGSTVLFVLHKGTKVTVQKVQDQWYEVKLPNGSVGWMPPATIERI